MCSTVQCAVSRVSLRQSCGKSDSDLHLKMAQRGTSSTPVRRRCNLLKLPSRMMRYYHNKIHQVALRILSIFCIFLYIFSD